jgi:hypothetical protein
VSAGRTRRSVCPQKRQSHARRAARVAKTAVAAIPHADSVNITVLSWPDARTASAFDPFDEEPMRLYTVAAGQAITNAGRWQHSRVTVTQLEQGLVSRSDIDMAKGALIAVHGCTRKRRSRSL